MAVSCVEGDLAYMLLCWVYVSRLCQLALILLAGGDVRCQER